MRYADISYASAAKAMLAATALAALMISAGMGGLPLFPFAYLVALFVTMPVGMLLYAVARVTGSAGWIAAGLGGLLTSAVLWLPDLFSPPSLDEEWFDGVATITGGHYTQLGWFQHLTPAVGMAAIGLISGLFFWFLLRRRTFSRRAQEFAYLLAVVAVLGAVAYPFVKQDHSCHTDYGRPTVAQMGLEIPPDQWPALASALNEFAQRRNWSARYGLSRSPNYPWLDFSMCAPKGPRIYVLASPDVGGFHLPVSVSLDQSQDGAEWNATMQALHDYLKARWPAAIRYQNAHGIAISGPPDWLAPKAPPAAPTVSAPPSPGSRP